MNSMQSMQIPFTPAEPPPAPLWGKESIYNARTLVGNWYEERRQYHQPCSRCTGYSIYKSDYAPFRDNAEDRATKCCVPPKEYELRARADGDGPKLLMNTQDYCEYLRNYTTTYDLMYNWEVRRAGCKPKPWRKWRLGADARWMPERDNALSYGNLTQFSYREAPMLPMVPNDWKTYDMATTNKEAFIHHRYPDSYTLCRTAAPKHVRREIDDLVMVKKLVPCDRCVNPKNNACCMYTSCLCPCHAEPPKAYATLVPGHTLRPSPPHCQTLFPASTRHLDEVKRQPHPAPVPGLPILESMGPEGPCGTKEICNQAMQELSFANQQKLQECGPQTY